MYSLLLPLQDGATPLNMASQNGHITVVKLLLEAKAEPDLQNKVTFAVVACSALVCLVSCIEALMEGKLFETIHNQHHTNIHNHQSKLLMITE